MLAGERKTSSVTSSPPLIPVAAAISAPTFVFASWKAGRQCMNSTFALPVRSSSAVFTWYGSSSFARSAQTSLGSPIETQTSVWTKSEPSTAATSSLMVIRAPESAASASARSITSAGGRSSSGVTMRTSEPRIAPVISSDRPMLKRPSPTNV